jgi:pimeloyl-ACP methyl ester carboxylesterase
MNFKFEIPYGNNEAVGKHVEINSTKIYYEEYGTGEPLLLIHGNGGSIESMGNQIDYFKTKYRVIIADNRGQVNLN